MVFQEEGSQAPWLRSFLSLGGPMRRDGSKELKADSDADDREERERAFDMADSLEMGLARELALEFMHPLRRASKLWRFHVAREDKLQYRLFSDDGAFLMYARACLEARTFSFSPYDPGEPGSLYDSARPAFTMSWSSDKTEWRLVQERCEQCQFSQRHLTCASCRGKQQVAYVRQWKEMVGDGVFNCMDAHIPVVCEDGSRDVWCPLSGFGDLASSSGPRGGAEVQHLVTKRPVWNSDVHSLVMDFKGRPVTSSAKNFQLAQEHKPNGMVCQYGKIGPEKFSLDFKYPLSVIQAFGIALTTLYWN